MERRSSKRVESLRASQRIECLLSPTMDPKLWGNLPPEVLLRIFQALPIRDFYTLRVVCKEWHNVACERRGFSNHSVPKPYFTLIRQGLEHSPTGTLAFNASSGRWIWRLHSPGSYIWHQIGDLYEPFVVEGIFFEGTAVWNPSHPELQRLTVGEPQNLLFNVHTDKGFLDFKLALGGRKIPAPPRIQNSILGMMVDTARRPYAYKLIMGNCNADTLILDSQTNTWEPKPSRMVRSRAPCKSANPKSCVQFDGRMYVWSESDEIQVYSLAEDKWSSVNAPPRHASDDAFRGLGHWQSALYAVTKNEQGTLSVWTLTAQEWREFAQSPSSLFSYLLADGARLPGVATHCNEYLLMHVLADWQGAPTRREGVMKRWQVEKLGRRYVLFNISNKRWEVVALPNSQLWK
jgi:hypothetical protein